jgi:hypothetical protein
MWTVSSRSCCAVSLCCCLLCRGRVRIYAHQWAGLADGASPEGVPFGGSGKPILRVAAGHITALGPDAYLKSFTRWVPVTVGGLFGV